MVVTGISHSCLLIELGPICKSMTASLGLKSCEDHSPLKSYNGGLWKNNFKSGPYKYPHTILIDNKEIQPTVCLYEPALEIWVHFASLVSSNDSNKFKGGLYAYINAMNTLFLYASPYIIILISLTKPRGNED